jgi:hypothetical protein
MITDFMFCQGRLDPKPWAYRVNVLGQPPVQL